MKKYTFKIIISLVILIAQSTQLAADTNVVPAAPSISASSYIMMDFDSQNLLVEQNVHEKLPPASLTKIMTIYVAANELKQGRISQEDMVTVSKKAWRMQGSRMFIEVGKQVAVADLLKGIIIQSGNDASVALAEHISGTEEGFVKLMNQYASKLGMENTSFMNSTGLPADNHYTTAYDLALLSRAFIDEFPEIYSMHSIKEFTFNKISQKNRNKLLWLDPTVDGLKTGHTDEAGYCLVASAKRDNMRLITVVMGTDGPEARAKASQSLLKHGFRFYETRQLYSADETIQTLGIWKGVKNEFAIGLEHDLILTVPRGKIDNISAHVETPETIYAPVKQGETIGTLIVSLGDEELVSTPVIALTSVQEAGFIKSVKDELQLMIDKLF